MGDTVCGRYLEEFGFAGLFLISARQQKVGKAPGTLARVPEMMDTPAILLDEQKKQSRSPAFLYLMFDNPLGYLLSVNFASGH